MTDLTKRNTLKTLATTAAVVSVGALPTMATAAKPATCASLEVRYSADGKKDVMVLHNSGADAIQVKMDFSGDIAVPGGRIDVGNLMNNGPIPLEAGETRTLSLARAANDAPASFSSTINGHQALRFPISDNVVVDNLQVVSPVNGWQGSTPVVMRKVA